MQTVIHTSVDSLLTNHEERTIEQSLSSVLLCLPATIDETAKLHKWCLKRYFTLNFRLMMNSIADAVEDEPFVAHSGTHNTPSMSHHSKHLSSRLKRISRMLHISSTRPKSTQKLSRFPWSKNLISSKASEDRLLVLLQPSHRSSRCNADLQWGERILSLVVKKIKLADENMYCTILGAAYAAIIRDNLNEQNAVRARDFAQRQIEIADKLGDRKLRRRGMIYVGYWLIFKKKFDRAGEIFRRQMEEAIQKMSEAAIVRNQQEKEAYQKSQPEQS